ncbi:hypothetical protein SODALDRAFT_331069 [Sodiomyces alkalinus F11]|uniref:Uncharacterized protein n=1 Tax=Sodiomyces alkalinus (strain CBS 110278 / VKM F-3762 / F11) TaxID=1314773 RepID=A0A3N2Q3K6_SODAK|nr:hypothetical protein SODALDRAFT_331069 [Sodiomyces alkalinus F11]ROT41343.1 hypothetical protein SODALDRAFT_331069 [Sodiomyces alkalinus F11]
MYYDPTPKLGTHENSVLCRTMIGVAEYRDYRPIIVNAFPKQYAWMGVPEVGQRYGIGAGQDISVVRLWVNPDDRKLPIGIQQFILGASSARLCPCHTSSACGRKRSF